MGRSEKMKFNYIIKSIPFLSTLLLIIFISISNQKEYTKLRILIWNTPSLTLGSYLAISAGTGFLFSYFITSNLAKIKQIKHEQSLKFKDEGKTENIDEYIESTPNSSYDNTLIERDITDPSPTIKASFRVIGRTERINTNSIGNNNIQYDETIECDNDYQDSPENNDNLKQSNSNSIDWYDESFSSW